MQTEMEKIWYLKHINIFKGMTEADLATVERMTHMKPYGRREQVYGQGDEGNVVYLLKEGRVKIYKLSPDGKELTLELLEPGEIFGEMALVDDSPRDTIAETLDDSMLCIMRRRDFELFLKKKPELAMRVTKLIGMRRRHIENQLENLVFRSASSRLALLLLSLGEIHGVRDSRGIILNIKLSQQELANLIGTARETTSALLNEFKRLGFIDIQRRRIKLLESWRLKKIADARMTDLPLPDEPDPTEPTQ
jgi:CRP/FNR family transcriptional regulator